MGGKAVGESIATGRRILIVKTSSIGDVIHALPMAEIVKTHLPASFVGW